MLEGFGLEVELYRFTVERYEAIAAARLLPERGVELVGGLLVDMSLESNDHAEAKRIAFEILSNHRDGRYRIYPSLSLRLGPYDMVDPDMVIVRLPHADLSSAPAPADVALIIEIANSSLGYDLGIKREKYAAAGISEYWVVDLRGNRVHMFARPNGGAYNVTRVATADETIAPLEFPDVSVAVGAIFAATG